MVAVGDSGTFLQLLAPLTPDSTIARFLDRSGPGVQQLAYRVTDIDEAMEAVREQGMRLLYDEPRRGTAGQPDQLHPPQGPPAASSSSSSNRPTPPDLSADVPQRRDCCTSQRCLGRRRRKSQGGRGARACSR